MSPVDQMQPNLPTGTVIAAKPVQLAIVEYVDEYGARKSQLAIVGDQSVFFVRGFEIGFSAERSERSGFAAAKVRDAVFEKLKGE